MREDLNLAFSLEGQAAVITGGASGIGLETACVFAQAGAKVMLADIDAEALASAVERVRAHGGGAHALRTDVAERAQVETLADDALRSLDRLDIWVNCAGVVNYKDILEVTEPDLERLLDINLKGSYWGCAAAGRIFKPRGGGVILNTSSTGADSCGAGLGGYPDGQRTFSGCCRGHRPCAAGTRAARSRPGFSARHHRNAARHCARHVVPRLRRRTLRHRPGDPGEWRRVDAMSVRLEVKFASLAQRPPAYRFRA